MTETPRSAIFYHRSVLLRPRLVLRRKCACFLSTKISCCVLIFQYARLELERDDCGHAPLRTPLPMRRFIRNDSWNTFFFACGVIWTALSSSLLLHQKRLSSTIFAELCRGFCECLISSQSASAVTVEWGHTLLIGGVSWCFIFLQSACVCVHISS